MCIIAIKPKNVAMPTKEILERMFDKNPHGAGVVYTTEKHTIKIVKGLMSKNEFLKVCEKIPTTAVAILHARISTSGGVCKELTHPYELTNDFKKLRRLTTEIANGYAVAHNGVFNEFGTMFEANDTMQFIATYLTALEDLKKNANGTILDADIKPIINKLVSGSRLVIIDNEGNWQKYGSNWEEHNGVYYSNGGYKKQENFWHGWKNWNDYCWDNYGTYYQNEQRREREREKQKEKELLEELQKEYELEEIKKERKNGGK
ncbi:MAG: hypothetical protein IKI95_02640 [Clostridia bacterium]|nr:hypothetical protein [Clostridia bacterium]